MNKWTRQDKCRDKIEWRRSESGAASDEDESETKREREIEMRGDKVEVTRGSTDVSTTLRYARAMPMPSGPGWQEPQPKGQDAGGNALVLIQSKLAGLVFRARFALRRDEARWRCTSGGGEW